MLLTFEWPVCVYTSGEPQSLCSLEQIHLPEISSASLIYSTRTARWDVILSCVGPSSLPVVGNLQTTFATALVAGPPSTNVYKYLVLSNAPVTCFIQISNSDNHIIHYRRPSLQKRMLLPRSSPSDGVNSISFLFGFPVDRHSTKVEGTKLLEV